MSWLEPDADLLQRTTAKEESALTSARGASGDVAGSVASAPVVIGGGDVTAACKAPPEGYSDDYKAEPTDDDDFECTIDVAGFRKDSGWKKDELRSPTEPPAIWHGSFAARPSRRPSGMGAAGHLAWVVRPNKRSVAGPFNRGSGGIAMRATHSREVWCAVGRATSSGRSFDK